MVLSITAYAQNYGVKSNTLSRMLISNSDTKFTLMEQSLFDTFTDYNFCGFDNTQNFNKKYLYKKSEQHRIGEYNTSLFFNKKLHYEVNIDKMGINNGSHKVMNKLWGMKFDIKLTDNYIDNDTHNYIEKIFTETKL